MFNLADTVGLDLPAQDGSIKLCVVRHPTDEEWHKRSFIRYTSIRNLGNGVTESKAVDREKADKQLLDAIQLNKEVVFDSDEAVTLIEQFANCDIIDIEKVGSTFEITLNTILGEVKHIIQIPSHKELRKTAEAMTVVRGGRFNQTMVKILLLPAKAIYDKYIVSFEGYDSEATKESIPLIHKHKVIDALHGEINNISMRSKTSGENDPFPMTPGPNTQV